MDHVNVETASAVLGALLCVLVLFELLSGKYRDGKKSKEDWAMAGISLVMLNAVQKPLLMAGVFVVMSFLLPQQAEALRWIDTQYFWAGLLAYMMIEDLLHGGAHRFSHTRTPKNPVLAKIHAFFRVAHRPHHFSGSNDGKGELNVTQTYVEGWAWFLILPNHAFAGVALYLGLYEIFFYGIVFKTAWTMHNHTNWNYDLKLLNHRNPLISNTMYALCHVITFPTMHQHHHSRGANSAKNMHNLFALYDWLIWGTLVIERKRPAIFGWRQKPEEEHSPLYRYFNTNLSR